MLPMFAICSSSRIFSRRAFSSGVRVLSGHVFYLLCDASILHLSGGLHKVWDGLGHVHNTRENTFLLRWREEIRNACTERHHVRGQFINVGCMMPWMDYQPRTLAEIIEREEAASHALRLWNKQGRISNLLHPISHLPDRYMAASFFPADVSQICAEIWHEHPSKIGGCQPVIFKITPAHVSTAYMPSSITSNPW